MVGPVCVSFIMVREYSKRSLFVKSKNVLGFGVRAVGLEPTCLVSYGFGDRCVCQFRHARTMQYQAGSILKCSPLLFVWALVVRV